MIRNHIPNFPSSNFSEDCLYLNIFAPNVKDCFLFYKNINMNSKNSIN
jgi:hypothetical protein